MCSVLYAMIISQTVLLYFRLFFFLVLQEGMAIVRDDVCEVLLEAEEGGGRALRRRQWGVFWVLGFAVYGRLLIKEIAGEAVSMRYCR